MPCQAFGSSSAKSAGGISPSGGAGSANESAQAGSISSIRICSTAGSRTALRLAAGASCAMDGGSFTFFFFPSFSRAKPMVSSFY